jgi:opacity protein-like surface antigen
METEMKRFATLIAATAVALPLAAPVFAGGPVEPMPEPEVMPAPMPVVAPSADWSGAYGGVQLGYGDVDTNGAGADGNGMTGGVHGGYRWDLGKTVLGVEGEYDAADISLGGGAGKVDSVARLKMMAGADLGSNLVYATAGAAWADGNLAGVDGSDNGYFYGIGLEHALNDRWSLGGEVLQHKFDDFDNSGVDVDATTFSARVNYRF